MPSLRVTAGNASGSEIPLEQEFAIGRSANGLGKLGDDPELSRTHARVSRDASGQVFIEDLGSTNGTFVNEQRITGARPLSPGDRIRVGHTSMTLEADAPAPPPPPPAVAPAPPPPPPPAPATQRLPAAPPQAAPAGPSNAAKGWAIVGGVLMLLFALIAGVITVELLTADEFEVRDGEIYQTTGADKTIAGIFGIPSTLMAIAVLPAAIYFAITGKRGRLVVILAAASVVLGLVGFGILAAD